VGRDTLIYNDRPKASVLPPSSPGARSGAHALRSLSQQHRGAPRARLWGRPRRRRAARRARELGHLDRRRNQTPSCLPRSKRQSAASDPGSTRAGTRITIGDDSLDYCVSGDVLRLGLLALGMSVSRRQ
jgi:hypothetical protein